VEAPPSPQRGLTGTKLGPARKSMIFGSMRREFYLKHYDPQRWTVEAPRPGTTRTEEEA
jgi:hypothetical protein